MDYVGMYKTTGICRVQSYGDIGRAEEGLRGLGLGFRV